MSGIYPDGVTQADIDRAAGGEDQPECDGCAFCGADSQEDCQHDCECGSCEWRRTMSNVSRPELTAPERIKRLPVDDRGYPVPWFVAWKDGQPEFRAADRDKYVRAIKEKRCWVCGDPLGVNVAFIAGPMCGINRTSSEPPSHYDCAKWSAINCPFLNNPQMVRREDALINNARLREETPGCAIARNPGVTMLWITRQYEIFNDGKGQPLIHMLEPQRVEWYANGREATRAEVQASIDSGLPALEAIAQTERGALDVLKKYVERFQKWIPE